MYEARVAWYIADLMPPVPLLLLDCKIFTTKSQGQCPLALQYLYGLFIHLFALLSVLNNWVLWCVISHIQLGAQSKSIQGACWKASEGEVWKALVDGPVHNITPQSLLCMATAIHISVHRTGRCSIISHCTQHAIRYWTMILSIALLVNSGNIITDDLDLILDPGAHLANPLLGRSRHIQGAWLHSPGSAHTL